MKELKSERIIKNFNKKGQKFYFWWYDKERRILPIEIVDYCESTNGYNVCIKSDCIEGMFVEADGLFNSRKELIEERIKDLEEVVEYNQNLIQQNIIPEWNDLRSTVDLQTEITFCLKEIERLQKNM